MGRKRNYVPLQVFFNSHRVGELKRESTGAVRFCYADSWLDWQNAFPISISIPLRNDAFVGAPVIAVFDNLLPDNELVRQRVATRVGAAGTDAYSLLSEIGRDCVGALQFLPEGQAPDVHNTPAGTPVSHRHIAQMLDELDTAPLGIRSEHDFRISIAGAQEKTALLYHDGQWLEPTGSTPTTHIIKPQIGQLSNGMDLSQSVENEYFCMTLMQGFGLKSAKVEIVQFEHHKALSVERFDRTWINNGQRLARLPQEDLCQALSIPPSRKYQSEGGPGIVEIINTFGGSDEAIEDRYDFLKTQILFWLIGATDGHAKNFSIALFPQGRFRTTPLYDILTLQPAYDAKQIQRKDFKMAMRVGRSNQYRVDSIQGRHFLDTAIESGLSRDTFYSIVNSISADKDGALSHTIDSMPRHFPQQIIDSVSSAINRRLPRLHALD